MAPRGRRCGTSDNGFWWSVSDPRGRLPARPGNRSSSGGPGSIGCSAARRGASGRGHWRSRRRQSVGGATATWSRAQENFDRSRAVPHVGKTPAHAGPTNATVWIYLAATVGRAVGDVDATRPPAVPSIPYRPGRVTPSTDDEEEPPGTDRLGQASRTACRRPRSRRPLRRLGSDGRRTTR